MTQAEIIPNATFLTIASLLYFQGVYSSEVILEESRNSGFKWDDVLAKMRGRKLVPLYNHKILLSTGLLTGPAWLACSIGGTRFLPILVYISIGAFLSPLSMPSSMGPDSDDLKSFPVFIEKWIGSKIFDTWPKTLCFTGVAALAGLLPGIRYVSNFFHTAFMPIVMGKPGSGVFEEWINGVFLVLVIMVMVRFSVMVGIHGFLFSSLFCLSIPTVWVTYQWFINEAFPALGSAAKVLTFSALSANVLDFMTDVISAGIERDSTPKTISNSLMAYLPVFKFPVWIIAGIFLVVGWRHAKGEYWQAFAILTAVDIFSAFLIAVDRRRGKQDSQDGLELRIFFNHLWSFLSIGFCAYIAIQGWK